MFSLRDSSTCASGGSADEDLASSGVGELIADDRRLTLFDAGESC